MEYQSVFQSIHDLKLNFISQRKKQPNCIILGEKEIECLKTKYGEQNFRNGIMVDGMIVIKNCNENFIKVGLIEEIGNVRNFRQ